MKPTIEPNTPRTVRIALPAGLAMLIDLIWFRGEASIMLDKSM